FDKTTQILSLFFVFFGSGLSGLVAIVQMLGLQPGSQPAYLSWLLGQGADAYYLDLFALPILAFYPYQAAAFILVSFVVLASTKLLAATGGLGSARRALLAGLLFLVLGLVRPYEAVTLLPVFNSPLLLGIFSDRGAHLKMAFAIGCIVTLLALPPIAYVGLATTLPVWGSFADSSMTLDPRGPGFYLKGFALLWSLAGLGVVVAITD